MMPRSSHVSFTCILHYLYVYTFTYPTLFFCTTLIKILCKEALNTEFTLHYLLFVMGMQPCGSRRTRFLTVWSNIHWHLQGQLSSWLLPTSALVHTWLPLVYVYKRSLFFCISCYWFIWLISKEKESSHGYAVLNKQAIIKHAQFNALIFLIFVTLVNWILSLVKAHMSN